MLARERQQNIVNMVNREGSVLVKELAEKFEVTEDSIRKDLTLLEKRGLLKKTYGGAVKARVNVHEIFVAQRRGKNTDEKKAIAKKAMELINEGDVVFLDISTTNSELINLIKESKLNITVVTNMIDIMLAFNEPMEAKLVFVGGALNRGRDGFVGGITNKQMESFRFDKAFLGAVGVDLDRNRVYTYRADDALTKSAVQKASGQTYIMLEERKFSADGNYMYSQVDEFTGIITDKKPEQDILDKLKKYDMKIYY